MTASRGPQRVVRTVAVLTAAATGWAVLDLSGTDGVAALSVLLVTGLLATLAVSRLRALPPGTLPRAGDLVPLAGSLLAAQLWLSASHGPGCSLAGQVGGFLAQAGGVLSQDCLGAGDPATVPTALSPSTLLGSWAALLALAVGLLLVAGTLARGERLLVAALATVRRRLLVPGSTAPVAVRQQRVAVRPGALGELMVRTRLPDRRGPPLPAST